MTNKEKQIIKSYEEELWDEMNFYKKSREAFSKEETLEAIDKLIDSYTNKWYSVHNLIEKLGIED